MERNPALDKLFGDWIEQYQEKGISAEGFSRDGIVDESLFAKAKPRLLFVLRETNNFPQSNEFGGDLRAFLRHTLKWQLWHTVGRWAYGILNDFPPYRETDSRESIHAAVCSVAIMNLKKITGGSWSDLDEINETAHRDRELILREIHIIDPQVIVACGTWGQLVWLFDLDGLPNQSKSSYTRGRLYLSTRHPVRANNQETYDQLKQSWFKVKDQAHSGSE